MAPKSRRALSRLTRIRSEPCLLRASKQKNCTSIPSSRISHLLILTQEPCKRKQDINELPKQCDAMLNRDTCARTARYRGCARPCCSFSNCTTCIQESELRNTASPKHSINTGIFTERVAGAGCIGRSAHRDCSLPSDQQPRHKDPIPCQS